MGDGCMDETQLEGVTRLSDTEFDFNNTHCFKIKVPNIGSAAAIYYDIAALNMCCQYIEKEHIKKCDCLCTGLSNRTFSC